MKEDNGFPGIKNLLNYTEGPTGFVKIINSGDGADKIVQLL